MPATFPSSNPRTLHDIVLQDYREAKDAKGNWLQGFVDILEQNNAILNDMIFKPANYGDDKYKYRVVTEYPKSYWARYGRGIPTSKAAFAMAEETLGKLKSAMQVEVELAVDQSGGSETALGSYLLDQEKFHVKAMARDMAKYLFYGDILKQEGEGFNGFATLYNSLNPNEEITKNIIDCGGTGPNLTSMWLIGWGDGCHGFYPKWSRGAGISRKARRRDIPDPEGNPIEHFYTEWKWELGLVVPDWRKVVRLVNIDVDELNNGQGIGNFELSTANAHNLITRVMQAKGLIYDDPGDRVAFYCNNDVMQGLNRVAALKNSQVVQFQQAESGFGKVGSINICGIPCRRVDALSSQEKRLVA